MLAVGSVGLAASDRSERGYRGPVSAVAERTFEHGYVTQTNVERFDREGRLLEDAWLDDAGEVMDRSIHHYGSDGRRHSTETESSPFLYLADRKLYVYDGTGQLSEEKGFDTEGRPVFHWMYRYDGEGNRVDWTSVSFHKNGDNRHRWVYEYDSLGRRTRQTAYMDDGNGFAPTDRLGWAFEELYFYGDGADYEVAVDRLVDGTVRRVRVAHWDQYGNQTESWWYDRDHSLESRTSYDYDYDEHGNWTECIARSPDPESGELTVRYTERRTIEYFAPREEPR